MRDAHLRFADLAHGWAVDRTRVRRLAVLAVLGALGLALGASSASAVVIYPQVASFGTNGTSSPTFGGASQVAFDQASKRLYVFNTSPVGIHGFDVSVPGTYTPLAPNPFITGLPTPGTNPDISVDNTGGGSVGRIYYVGQTAATLSGFSSSGASLGAPFAPLTPPTPKTLCGTAVDSAGNIAIGNSNNTARNVLRYDSSGNALTSISTTTQGGGPCEVAFDSNDDLYFALLNGATWRYTAASGYSSASAQQFDAVATRALAVNRVTHNVYVAHANKVNIYSSAGAPLTEFATGLSTNFRGIAVNESTGVVFVSDPTNGRVRVFTPVAAPVPTTGAVSNLARNTVTLGGHVEPDGGGDVTDCHFEYIKDTAFKATGYTDLSSGGSKPCSQATPLATGQDVSADLTGLTTDTMYHFRFVAANANLNSTNAGSDQTFTTPTAVAGVSTGDAKDITQTSATLHGSFTGDGLATTYKFEWGPTSAYGNVVEASAGSPTGVTAVSEAITGLSVRLPSSLPYHYRLVATNSTGTTIGPDKTFFSAPPSLPQVTGTAVDNVTANSAEVSADINPGNGETLYRVQYGPSLSYGSSTPVSESVGEDDTFHAVSTTLLGLTPGTTYHFRVVAINFSGTTHGPDHQFTTPAAPTIEMSSSTGVGQTVARLGALVAPNSRPTSVSFEYGQSPAYGIPTAAIPIGADALGSATVDLGGLSPGTTYHFRAVATNEVGTTYGPDQSFTTEQKPAEKAVPAALKCRKGFVKRNGKCVKKKKRKSKQRQRNG